ncbi:DNA-deoxyinosine glycosylase [Hydrogenoanaerobacterium sp.]|uniref:DNA-deoxyinosine glycosylase n=1 Tax=Hydrogenoanaerobacterium sp. TaxID=2953763 RepID=UPI0028971E61|nr:DNA-deoxyinosine glycosylase [Hydrogenoanaerobacterium sp.]
MDKVQHTLSPVFNERSRILILGTMPSPKSREVGFYYGHPQNRFWRVTAAVLNTAVPQTNSEKQAFLLDQHIALWDVLQQCEIEGADDSSIRKPVANDFSRIFSTADIRQVFTTGAAATKLYTKLAACAVEYPAFYLPSTSPANCRVSFEAMVKEYSVIKKYL